MSAKRAARAVTKDAREAAKDAAEAALLAGAAALIAGAPAFTRRNLAFAARRVDPAVTDDALDACLRKMQKRGDLPGLLSEKPSTKKVALPGTFPRAVLLVDRPPVLGLLGALLPADVAVVCVDGSPKALVAWIARGFREGARAPILYLHDAATVLFPFTLEPVASRVAAGGGDESEEALGFKDLGLNPLGASARRFGDPSLPADALLLDLEAIPPATLARFCERALAQSFAPSAEPGAARS